eukprot:g1492.t1
MQVNKHCARQGVWCERTDDELSVLASVGTELNGDAGRGETMTPSVMRFFAAAKAESHDEAGGAEKDSLSPSKRAENDEGAHADADASARAQSILASTGVVEALCNALVDLYSTQEAERERERDEEAADRRQRAAEYADDEAKAGDRLSNTMAMDVACPDGKAAGASDRPEAKSSGSTGGFASASDAVFDGKAGGAHGGIGGRKGKGTSDTSSDSPQHPELAAEEGNAMAAARAAVDRERERQAQVVAELDSLRAMLEAERERHAAELRSLRAELQFALLTARQNSAASAEGTSLAHYHWRINEFSSEILKCPVKGACKGGGLNKLRWHSLCGSEYMTNFKTHDEFLTHPVPLPGFTLYQDQGCVTRAGKQRAPDTPATSKPAGCAQRCMSISNCTGFEVTQGKCSLWSNGTCDKSAAQWSFYLPGVLTYVLEPKCPALTPAKDCPADPVLLPTCDDSSLTCGSICRAHYWDTEGHTSKFLGGGWECNTYGAINNCGQNMSLDNTSWRTDVRSVSVYQVSCRHNESLKESQVPCVSTNGSTAEWRRRCKGYMEHPSKCSSPSMIQGLLLYDYDYYYTSTGLHDDWLCCACPEDTVYGAYYRLRLQNPLCTACSPKHFKGFSGKCERCDSIAYYQRFLVALAGLALVFLAIRVAHDHYQRLGGGAESLAPKVRAVIGAYQILQQLHRRMPRAMGH